MGFVLVHGLQLLADVVGDELGVRAAAKDASPGEPRVVEPVPRLGAALLQDPVVADQIAAAVLQLFPLIFVLVKFSLIQW